ncbi:hypothetical protein, partial [Pseudomonas fluorescens]|uniref:hypothetical protein n=1 Tax=Pseudomonas fluorescens TaxID=294 RepID=UPI0022A81920
MRRKQIHLSPFLSMVASHGPSSHTKVNKTLPTKKGSSRITGKDALDLHEKEFAIPVTVRHPLD